MAQPMPFVLADIDWGAMLNWLMGGGLNATLILAIVAALAICLVIVVLHLTKRDVDASWKDKRLRFPLVSQSPHDEPLAPDDLKWSEALYMLAELSQGMLAIIDAGERMSANVRTVDWFRRFAQDLGHVLGQGPGDRYRVTVWTAAKEDDKILKALGQYLASSSLIPIRGSVAGYCFENRTEHYVSDCENDPIYRPLNAKPKDYKSMFGIFVGAEDDPWGAITVDAKPKHGLSATDRLIVRSFAGLASAVGAAWWKKSVEEDEDDKSV
jgi:hypothetical protein